MSPEFFKKVQLYAQQSMNKQHISNRSLIKILSLYRQFRHLFRNQTIACQVYRNFFRPLHYYLIMNFPTNRVYQEVRQDWIILELLPAHNQRLPVQIEVQDYLVQQHPWSQIVGKCYLLMCCAKIAEKKPISCVRHAKVYIIAALIAR